MCKMDKPPTRVAPFMLVMILSICLISLLARSFAGYNLPVAQSSAIELIVDGEKDNPGQSAGADFLLLPQSSLGMNPQRLPRIISPPRIIYTSLASLPLLPPPIVT